VKDFSSLLQGLVVCVGFCIAQGSVAQTPEILSRYTITHKGWANTTGGAGGQLIKITSLASSGPGSLKEALETPGSRTLVFEVGGVIDLQGQSWKIKEPHLTIAGQTAPNPGITLIKGELEIETHDVIVQHIMFRPGEFGRPKRSGGDHDGLNTTNGAHNIIVDHCSFSWATDENLSASGPRFKGKDPAEWRLNTSHQITFSHNLIYEGLSESVHIKGEHSKGSLIHDNATDIFIVGNIYASNVERNALFKGGVYAAMVNNLIYNPGARAVHYNLVAHEWLGHPYQTGRLTLVGNVYRQGPNTQPQVPFFTLGGDGDVELYLADNMAQDRHGQPVPMVGRYTSGKARMVAVNTPRLPQTRPYLPPQQLEAELMLKAGARPWNRDPIDFKQLSDIAEDRGTIVHSETENAHGMPMYKSTYQKFDAMQWNLQDMSPVRGWVSLETAPE
jgi:pectate lyase